MRVRKVGRRLPFLPVFRFLSSKIDDFLVFDSCEAGGDRKTAVAAAGGPQAATKSAYGNWG
jgi:hypothetical protein